MASLAVSSCSMRLGAHCTAIVAKSVYRSCTARLFKSAHDHMATTLDCGSCSTRAIATSSSASVCAVVGSVTWLAAAAINGSGVHSNTSATARDGSRSSGARRSTPNKQPSMCSSSAWSEPHACARMARSSDNMASTERHDVTTASELAGMVMVGVAALSGTSAVAAGTRASDAQSTASSSSCSVVMLESSHTRGNSCTSATRLDSTRCCQLLAAIVEHRWHTASVAKRTSGSRAATASMARSKAASSPERYMASRRACSTTSKASSKALSRANHRSSRCESAVVGGGWRRAGSESVASRIRRRRRARSSWSNEAESHGAYDGCDDCSDTSSVAPSQPLASSASLGCCVVA